MDGVESIVKLKGCLGFWDLDVGVMKILMKGCILKRKKGKLKGVK